MNKNKNIMTLSDIIMIFQNTKMKEIIKISRKKKSHHKPDQIVKHCLTFNSNTGGQKSMKYAIKII